MGGLYIITKRALAPPVDFEVSVASNPDDGFGSPDGWYGGSSTAYIQLGKSGLPIRICFFRFDNVLIPANSTILSAKMRVYAYSSSTVTLNLVMHVDKTSNSVTPTDYTDLDSRPLTSGTNWQITDPWTNAFAYYTSDFSVEIQELIDGVVWSSGNAMTVIVKNAIGNTTTRSLRHYPVGLPARLIVQYRPPN